MLTFVLIKKIFYRFIAFITIFSDIKKITGSPNYFEMLSVRRLKKVENHWFNDATTQSKALFQNVKNTCLIKI